MYRRALALFALLSVVPSFMAADPAPATSPWLPPPSAATPPSNSDRWEFVGLLGTPAAPVVLIKDTVQNASSWLRVGDSFGALKVISASIDKNLAIVQVGTELVTLTLRQTKVAPGEAAPAGADPSPSASPPADTAAAVTKPTLPSTGDPVADAKRDREIAEREARMLVSDLLEISMIQRKAFEEKQAAAAEAPR